MNDDELRNLWQQQPLRIPDLPEEQLISAMQKKMTGLRRSLFWRDIREVVACVFLIMVFGFYFFHQRAPIARVGDLIVIGSSIFIAWRLVRVRRMTPPAPLGATIPESLRAELNSARAQSRLLGTVQWWYLLPLTVGELVFIWGDTPSFGNIFATLLAASANIFVTLVVIAVNVFVYWLNQWARRKQLLPMETQLEALLHSAETGEPLDQTRVANLRPIVLSMAAAGQVQPIEFKVAFWQIALYGEIAMVGIWLCLMIGLGMDQENKTPMPGMKPAARSVPAAETNRYWIVARKVVDLVNAGDYAGLQNLYDTEMREAFPPQKMSEFYKGLAKDYGSIGSFDGPNTNGYQGWPAFRMHGQDGELIMSLALDEDGKISGIYFEPAPKPPLSVERLIAVFFNCRHLAWLVPFLIAGLVYSWLLQKATRKAVGISNLGIHLHKGQNLILWDEITEVRPLRILNIRSLWLIRESGEKTIMPWTSLERHSDLKAAVENFAPANHPLRQHLALLRAETNASEIAS